MSVLVRVNLQPGARGWPWWLSPAIILQAPWPLPLVLAQVYTGLLSGMIPQDQRNNHGGNYGEDRLWR